MRHTDSLKRHGKVTIAFDLFIIVLSAALALTLRWGGQAGLNEVRSTEWLLFSTPIVWFIALSWQNAWVFTGFVNESESYRRVIRAGLTAFVGISTISFAFKGEFSRGFVLLSTVIATSALLLQRRFSWNHFRATMKKRGIRERGLVFAGADGTHFLETVSIDFPHAELLLADSYEQSEKLETYLTNVIEKSKIDFVVCSSVLKSSADWIETLIRVADNLDCQFFLVDPLRMAALRREPQLRGLNVYSRLAEPRLWHSKALFKRATDIAVSFMDRCCGAHKVD
jgi:FlaA1/EpsC-like NDP-sugar epimerase